MNVRSAIIEGDQVERIVARLGQRVIVLVGMMGAGKTSIGRRLANVLRLPFLDADAEIEKAANLTIPEIFERYGEAPFREGEQRVVARLLDGGPSVVATGGGAFMNADTRARCRDSGITIWLKADVPTLLERVRKKNNRPLLAKQDPDAVLRRLLDEREPYYRLADLTVASRDGPHQAVIAEILAGLDARLGAEPEKETAS
jgi:shikimate kinase